MILKGLRIGYVPYTGDLSAPADRRRFCYYAKRRNLAFEIAKPSEAYDLVILTQRADLSVWHKYCNGNAGLVYDAIDSYLAIPQWDLKGKLRGLSKFVTRQSRYLQLNHQRAIQQICQRADAVICTTEEQKKCILPFCENIHIILDFHANDIRVVKTNYSCGDVFNFVWEGLASSGIPFDLFREILDPIGRQRRIALHLVTDLAYYRYHDKYVKCDTVEQARKVFADFTGAVYLYQWNAQLLSSIISGCDLALIPIPLNDAFRAGKPENKLVLFWRIGVPTVVSATPAYERVMQRCGLPMACRTLSEWHTTIEKYMDDESARRHTGETGRRFAEENYGEEVLLKRWDTLFDSL